MGIEPTLLAWKAKVLPLNYTRVNAPASTPAGQSAGGMVEGGGFEPPKLTQQIYSLPPLTAREPLRQASRTLSIESDALSTHQHS